MASTPLVYANAIVADPHVNNVLSAIWAAQASPPPQINPPITPQASIHPSNAPARSTTSTTPRNVRRTPHVVVIDDSSDEEDGHHFFPQSTTQWVEYNEESRQAWDADISRRRKKAIAKDIQYEKARQVSSTSSVYPDDGTEDLIVNLSINDIAEDHGDHTHHRAYVVFAGLQPGIYDTWCAAATFYRDFAYALLCTGLRLNARSIKFLVIFTKGIQP